jgi:hypothetical protein
MKPQCYKYITKKTLSLISSLQTLAVSFTPLTHLCPSSQSFISAPLSFVLSICTSNSIPDDDELSISHLRPQSLISAPLSLSLSLSLVFLVSSHLRCSAVCASNPVPNDDRLLLDQNPYRLGKVLFRFSSMILFVCFKVYCDRFCLFVLRVSYAI